MPAAIAGRCCTVSRIIHCKQLIIFSAIIVFLYYFQMSRAFIFHSSRLLASSRPAIRSSASAALSAVGGGGSHPLHLMKRKHYFSVHTASGSDSVVGAASASSVAASNPSLPSSAVPLKVASYNVLSSSLSAPSYFTECSPEWLSPRYRLQSLLKKLEPLVEDQSIICLQEVSNLWSGTLHSFFYKRNYAFITGMYGRKFDGYMGVAIAVPLSKYEIGEVDITRIADTKQLPRKPRDLSPSWLSRYMRQMSFKFWHIMKASKFYQPPFDVWDAVVHRHNQMVSVQLRDLATKDFFVCGTYHMPCMFREPAVMIAHCALAAQHIHKIADGAPYILTGDFNIKPDSSMYKLLTEGSLDPSHPHLPQVLEGDTWAAEVKPPLRSAYKTATGSEPDFTNYAKTAHQDEPFMGTLDYIFHSEHWSVNSADSLPSKELIMSKGASLPMEDEPSDHLMVSATLQLKQSNGSGFGSTEEMRE